MLSNWHIDAICEHLEACTRGEITRLVINIPPGHMKSLLTAVFWNAWEWIDQPDTRWLTASHSMNLATRDTIKTRRLIQSEWYQSNWGGGFDLTSDQNTKTHFENNKTGFRQASSVGSRVLGQRGDRVVIDDPINPGDAASDLVREGALTWWDQEMSTRINDPETSVRVIVMQRLHERDLSGHLLEMGGWEHLMLPMQFEPERRCVTVKGTVDERKKDGDFLWPERFGQSSWDEYYKTLGSYGMAGQLQQRPAPRGGGMFRREWFEKVRAAPAGLVEVRHWDLAATVPTQGTAAAYSAGVKIGRDNKGVIYILDVRRMRESALTVERAITNTAAQDGKRVKISLPQDPGQAGKAQAQYYVRLLQGYDVRARPETGSKEQRAEPVSAQAEAGNIKIVKAKWNEDFLRELELFPMGQYKDQVDALSGAFNALVRTTPGTPNIKTFSKDSVYKS